MKTQRVPAAGIVGLVVVGMSVLLVGCSKHGSEAPKEGYAGGQKAGAVNNTSNSAGQTPRGGGYGQGSSGGMRSSGGMGSSGGGMGSGGR